MFKTILCAAGGGAQLMFGIAAAFHPSAPGIVAFALGATGTYALFVTAPKRFREAVAADNLKRFRESLGVGRA